MEIYLFGSILRKDFGPNSDVDVLVVSHKPIESCQKSKLIARLKNIIGFVNPFEIHLVTHKDYKEWYSKFIKEKQAV
ncbi:MAG: nucleotidyltransferase domain-containing protein [Elusimicrobia bacterium]|nr:nucleotidyltransferase domain-containing protein [Elusimicrobiota bacterium]